ncbi:MAG: formate--tetrahydrofolate ligase [Fastidiosipilaceae bacterium]
MLSDIEIARRTALKPVSQLASELGIMPKEIFNYGTYKAKLDTEAIQRRMRNKPNGKLVLVTAVNPTPAGEGKTTMTVGLGQALNRLGHKTMIALREPSLGPVFGIKGGAAGGGYSQVVPMEDINLHFTGDLHAVTAANNLCSAILDNHIQQGNELNIDPRRIVWKRCLDMNDRVLRNVVVGLGGPFNGTPREDHFQITVASEVMAVFCLASNLRDLRERLAKIVVAFTYDGQPVTTADLKVDGAMTVLLKDAFNPNLVQTLENTPALMHGGPFANIAHGCNSLAATKLGLKLADILVTEAGFGADLGAEKFFDIKCRYGDLKPDVAVIVTTVRSLKYNGNVPKDQLRTENLDALKKGIANLDKHLENLQKFGVPCVVSINRFASDTDAELDFIVKHCESKEVRCAIAEVFTNGGAGGEAAGKEVLAALETERQAYRPLYPLAFSLEDKILTIAKEIYGAGSVQIQPPARKALNDFTRMGYGDLPVCMAKTQYSLSDNPALLGRPENFELTVRDATLSAGAGFIVCLTGDVMTMPGLAKKPSAQDIFLDDNGQIQGLF